MTFSCCILVVALSRASRFWRLRAFILNDYSLCYDYPLPPLYALYCMAFKSVSKEQVHTIFCFILHPLFCITPHPTECVCVNFLHPSLAAGQSKFMMLLISPINAHSSSGRLMLPPSPPAPLARHSWEIFGHCPTAPVWAVVFRVSTAVLAAANNPFAHRGQASLRNMANTLKSDGLCCD